jgi:hypothetical protein
MQGGYMPNVVWHCLTKREAQAIAVEWANESRESGYSVVGSARSGFYEIIDPNGGPYHLGYYVEISEISEEDYEPEDE